MARTIQLTLDGTPPEPPQPKAIPFTEYVMRTRHEGISRGMKMLHEARKERESKVLTSIYQYPGPDD